MPRVVASLAVLLLILASSPVVQPAAHEDQAKAAGEACGLRATLPAVEISLRADGDLLAAGAAYRLAGMEWIDAPPDAPAGPVPAALTGWVSRGPAQVLVLPGPADRWDRQAALPGRNGVPAAYDFIAAGLAVVRPDDVPARCARVLLAGEELARAGRRGLWASPTPRADDAAALTAAEGRFAVMEGRISSRFEGSTGLVLQFGAPGERSLTVTVPKRSLRRFEASGMTGAAMEGRRVRVRGVVVGRDRPRMDVAVPEALERLD